MAMTGSPVLFTSALTGYAIEQMLRAARTLDGRLDEQLPTGQLNKVLLRLTDRNPPPHIEGRRFRIYYAVQTGTRTSPMFMTTARSMIVSSKGSRAKITSMRTPVGLRTGRTDVSRTNATGSAGRA